jgi:nucleoside-triphosphatase THEP1
MTAASAALRADSGTTAVMLHGMPGIGKTACMLELAYLCQDQFSAAAFWRPPAGNDPGLVLQSLADALHKQLGESGIMLDELGRSEEAAGVYDEVVARFGEATEPALRQ